MDGLHHMRGGLYAVYVRCSEAWFELDDQDVRFLAEHPKRFLYLLFLTRVERMDTRRLVRGKRPGTFCSFAAEYLFRDRVAFTGGTVAHGGGPGDRSTSSASHFS